ncbi:hypothetical protein BC332_10406 [Capsicum chinense]|nr:hypothetical protein BC332_10406 [Capsicum chinense]
MSTVCVLGKPPDAIACKSHGDVNRTRQALCDRLKPEGIEGGIDPWSPRFSIETFEPVPKSFEDSVFDLIDVPTSRIEMTLNLVNNKMQAMALQDLPVDVVEIKEKLFPLGDIITCLKYCKVESDCDDSWLCTNCVPSAFEGWRAQYDKRTVTDKGYFGTIL